MIGNFRTKTWKGREIIQPSYTGTCTKKKTIFKHAYGLPTILDHCTISGMSI